MLYKDIISTNTQKVLNYLLFHSNKPLHERAIARGAKVSYGSANPILKHLLKKDIVKRKIEGKMCFYSVNINDSILKEFKILNNLLLIEPLIDKLKPYSYKIVLYGSWANGTDTVESDIDLFIVSGSQQKIQSIIDTYSRSTKMAGKKIQAIIDSPEDLLTKDTKQNVFLNEVNQGKILWEKELDEHIF